MNRRSLLVAVAAAAFLSCIFTWTVFAGVLKDSWLAFERKGHTTGYEHLVASDAPGGGIEYSVERGYKIDVVGMSQQDIREKGKFTVDKDLAPVSFEMDSEYKVKKSRISGAVKDGMLVVRYDDLEGGVRERSFSAAGLHFDVSVPDVIRRRAPEKEFSFAVFDLHDTRSVAVKVVSAAENGTLEAEVTTRGYFAERVTIDAAGCVIRSERAVETLEKVGNASVQSDAGVTGKLKAIIDDTSDLTVKIDKPFGNAKKVLKAKVALRWMNIPSSDFALEDNRQKVAGEKVEPSGLYEVTLELSRFAPATAAVALSSPPAGMEKYLASSEYIVVDDTAVVELATKLGSGESDAVRLVMKIMKWIDGNVKTDFIAETLSAPEVLKKRCGKCSENAILFAALARALKIPTKISLGVYNTGNRWMGHMWNEVFIGGKWIAVDPSSEEFASGVSHIKFTESDTVDGTQNVRIKLIDNLGISVLEVESEKIKGDLKTGVEKGVYTSADYGCRVKAPGEKWKLKEEKAGDIVTVTAKLEGAEKVDIALVMFSVPGGGLTPKFILENRLAALGTRMPDFKKISEADAKVAGLEAAKVLFSHSGGKQKKATFVNENVMLVAEGTGFLFAFIATEEDHKKHGKDFEKFLESFELVK